MTLDELVTIISTERNIAVGADGSKLSTERRAGWESYNGEPLGNEIDGRSKIVMRTTLETVEWMLPALLRLFTQGKIASVEPRRPDQEKAADQATDYVDYIFNEDNPGFLILYTWIKDAAISKLAWVKYRWDTEPVEETVSFANLTAEQYEAVKTDPEWETINVEDETEHPAYVPDPMSSQPDVAYDCRIRRKRKEGRIKIEPVPPEEVLFSHRAKAIDRDLSFVCHRREWKYSDLLDQGYDEEVLEQIAGVDTPWLNTEKLERFETSDDIPFGETRTDKPMLSCWVDECYIRVDWNDDGLAELNKVMVGASIGGGGSAVLTKKKKPDIEEVPEIPLVPLSLILMPHTLVGMGISDLTEDLQVINTTLMRQVLDAGYFSLAPRMIAGQAAINENTIDDLLTVRPGQVIRAKDPTALVPLPNNFSPEQHLPLLEWVGQVGEMRTGISRRNQGLSPDDLNETATGISLIQQAADQRIDLIARVVAHAVKRLVEGILSYVKRYQQTERIVKLTGKWVTFDPRQWKDQMDVKVSVGLGTGNRDQIVAHVNNILQMQEAVIKLQGGLNGPLVTAQNAYDALTMLVDNSGIKKPLFTDPSEQQPGQQQPPPPNPEMMKAQHEIQLNQAKAQQDAQLAQAKAQQDAQTEQVRAQADMEIAQAELAGKMKLAEAEHMFKVQMAEREFQHKMALERYSEDRKFEISKYEIDARAKAGAYTPGPAPKKSNARASA